MCNHENRQCRKCVKFLNPNMSWYCQLPIYIYIGYKWTLTEEMMLIIPITKIILLTIKVLLLSQHALCDFAINSWTADRNHLHNYYCFMRSVVSYIQHGNFNVYMLMESEVTYQAGIPRSKVIQFYNFYFLIPHVLSPNLAFSVKK